VVGMTGGLLAVARARGAGVRTAAILSMVAFMLTAMALALRPQLFGIDLLVLLLWLVASRDRHPRLFLAGPLVIALWANLHGTFVLGLVVLGYAWLEDMAAHRPARTSLLVLAAGLAATLVNPYGAGIWDYAVGIGSNPAITGLVSEWQRTSPLRMPGALFYPSVVIGGLLLWRFRARMTAPAWLLAGGMAALAMWTERGVAWWALALVFVLAGVLPGAPGGALAGAPGGALAGARGGVLPGAPGGALAADGTRAVRTPRASLVNGVMAAVLGLLVVAALPWWRPADPLIGRSGLLSYAPSGLAGFVRTISGGAGARVVVPQVWGSFFEWAAPDVPYFIDSRFELFPATVWDDDLALSGPDAASVLDRWQATVLVLRPGDRVPVTGGWRQVYADADGVVLQRP